MANINGPYGCGTLPDGSYECECGQCGGDAPAARPMTAIKQLDEIIRLTVMVAPHNDLTNADYLRALNRRNELVHGLRESLHFLPADAALWSAYADGRKDEADAWQPLETAPEDTHILLALRLGHHSIGWWTDDGDGRKWFHQGKPHESLSPLAWMPLPKHPEVA